MLLAKRNLALTLVERGDLAEDQRLKREVLEEMRKVAGPRDPWLLMSMQRRLDEIEDELDLERTS